MNNYEQYFNWPVVHLEHFYIYFALAGLTALYLVVKSDSKYKIELFFLSFFLLTGNLNDMLTVKIPGFSFFELQPIRLLYLLLLLFIIRTTFLSKDKQLLKLNKKTPWFVLLIYAYVILLILSVVVNITHMGVPDGLKVILDAAAFLILLTSLRLMADKPSYDLIGKTIIIGAVVSSLVSLVQISIDPYFLRIGDARLAFGELLRSNGIFSTEYFNSYYLIIAIAWTLVTIKKNWLKTSLLILFSLGVISTFQRMSWVILVLIFITYLVFIQKAAIEKLLLIGLTSLALVLSLSIFYYQDIMNSTMVKERLSQTVEGREGYYTMVLDNIGKKPLFGFGDLKNEVYYVNLLRITKDRDRATATTGDLHSGYFSAMFLYGIPAFVCFTLFVLFGVFYYSKAFNDNLYFVIPFLVSILYMIGNLTNTFLFLKYVSVLYAIHIGIGMGINKIREQAISKD
ncbi:MAG: O-antigen ligase family protein [Maribacter sp.]